MKCLSRWGRVSVVEMSHLQKYRAQNHEEKPHQRLSRYSEAELALENKRHQYHRHSIIFL